MSSVPATQLSSAGMAGDVSPDLLREESRRASPMSVTVGSGAGRTRYLIAAICIAIIAVMLAPIVMSLFDSIKSTSEASQSPPTYVPHTLSADNFDKVVRFQAGLSTYLFNSISVAALTILFCLVLAVPAGYGLARFRFPGREAWFLLLLSGMMIPYQSLLTPLYLMFTDFHIANTHVGLAILHTVLQLPFSVYLMRHAFEAVPKELEEAGVIDGCNSFQVLWRILLPAVKAGVVTVILFAFITSWNEFLGALIFMSKETQFTIPIWTVSVRTGRLGAVDWGALQASIIIAIIPCIAVYVLLQKYYVSGFLSGAVK
jgi:multiple sugar transport system permease protein